MRDQEATGNHESADDSDPYEVAGIWPSVLPLYYESDELYGGDPWEWQGPEFDPKATTAGIRAEAQRRIRRYLAMNGAAVWERVERATADAERLRETHPASSLVSSITAAELLMRFLLLRPLIAGLVFDTRLAMRLIRDPFGRTQLDRKLLPSACRAWDVDLEGMVLPNGQGLWDTLNSLIDVRHYYVHRAEAVSARQAQGGLDCTSALVSQVLQPLAARVGLAWPPTGWNVKGRTHDPVEENYDYMGS